MGSKYDTGINPFHDFLFTSMLYGVDISDKKVKLDLYTTLSYLIDNYLGDENDIKFFDFEIKKTNNKYKVIGKNLISTLWLSGIIPNNTMEVVHKKKLIFRNIEYTFDEVKMELKMKKIKNG